MESLVRLSACWINRRSQPHRNDPTFIPECEIEQVKAIPAQHLQNTIELGAVIVAPPSVWFSEGIRGV